MRIFKRKKKQISFCSQKASVKGDEMWLYVFCHRTWRRSFVVDFWESGPPEVPWNALNYFRFGRFFFVSPSTADTSEPSKQAIGTGSLSRCRHVSDPLDIHNRSPVQQKQLRNIRATLRTVFALFHLSDSRWDSMNNSRLPILHLITFYCNLKIKQERRDIALWTHANPKSRITTLLKLFIVVGTMAIYWLSIKERKKGNCLRQKRLCEAEVNEQLMPFALLPARAPRRNVAKGMFPIMHLIPYDKWNVV